jgi:hypothetical protein
MGPVSPPPSIITGAITQIPATTKMNRISAICMTILLFTSDFAIFPSPSVVIFKVVHVFLYGFVHSNATDGLDPEQEHQEQEVDRKDYTNFRHRIP